MLRLLAFVDAIATAIWLVWLLFEQASIGSLTGRISEPTATHVASTPPASFGATLLSIGLVALAGVINFIFLMGASEGATALRNVEREIIAFGRTRRL